MRDEEFNDADNAADREYSRGRLAGIKASEKRYLELKAWAERARDALDEANSRVAYTYSNVPEYPYEKIHGLVNDTKERLIKVMKVINPVLSSLPKELKEKE